MNTSAETPVKPSKGSRAFTVLKGLGKIGAVCAVLLLMVNINDQLRSINSTANHTALKLNGLSKTLDEFFAPVKEKTSAEKTETAKVVSAGGEGGVALCYANHSPYREDFSGFLPDESGNQYVLICRFSDFSLKPASYCGEYQDYNKNSTYARICMKSLLEYGWKMTHFAARNYTRDGNSSDIQYNFIFEK